MPTLVSISTRTALEVRAQILGCESCTDDAEIPLSWVLDDVTGRSGAETDYVYLLSEPIKCPRCASEVTEETLVEW
jgi:hypothetical protein